MDNTTPRTYGGLVREAEKRDIGRTKAFELAKEGLIETFRIGHRRYVYIDSLDTLPARLDSQPRVAA